VVSGNPPRQSVFWSQNLETGYLSFQAETAFSSPQDTYALPARQSVFWSQNLETGSLGFQAKNAFGSPQDTYALPPRQSVNWSQNLETGRLQSNAFVNRQGLVTQTPGVQPNIQNW
jgi:hypothetical protein